MGPHPLPGARLPNGGDEGPEGGAVTPDAPSPPGRIVIKHCGSRSPGDGSCGRGTTATVGGLLFLSRFLQLGWQW